MVSFALKHSVLSYLWLGGVAVGRRISEREVESSPSCSAAWCNSGHQRNVNIYRVTINRSVLGTHM